MPTPKTFIHCCTADTSPSRWRQLSRRPPSSAARRPRPRFKPNRSDARGKDSRASPPSTRGTHAHTFPRRALRQRARLARARRQMPRLNSERITLRDKVQLSLRDLLPSGDFEHDDHAHTTRGARRLNRTIRVYTWRISTCHEELQALPPKALHWKLTPGQR